MGRGVVTITLWLVVVVGMVPAFGENKPDSSSDTSRAVAIVRLLSTAEIDSFRINHRYVTFAELVKSNQLTHTVMESPEHFSAFRSLNLQSDSEPVLGYLLDLTVAPDGASYKLSLTHKAVNCAPGLFTDEKGILYEGKPLDCAVEEQAPVSVPTWAEADSGKALAPVRTDMACPLEHLLQETSNRVQDLGNNLQQFSAKERIDHVEAGKNGKARTTTSVFDYVAEIHQEDPEHTYVEEYRTGPNGLETSAAATLADTGTAAFALIFHPRHIDEFAVECDGASTLADRRVWQLRFAQRPDRVNDFHAFRVGKVTYHVKLKGRAWIAADNYQVARLETDLLEPIKEIDLKTEHMVIDYAPVEFQKHNVQLWLPENASVYVDYRGRRYERRHNFSDFQLFWVEAEQKVKEPHPGLSFADQKN